MTIQEKVVLIILSPIYFRENEENFLQEWSIFNKSSFQQRFASFNKEFDSFFQNQGIFNEVKSSLSPELKFIFYHINI